MAKKFKPIPGITQSFVPQPGQSMPNQSNVLGGTPPLMRPTPSQLPIQTPQESATTIAQKAAGQAFIQQREKLTSKLLAAGVTGNPTQARQMASGQISGVLDAQGNPVNTNPSFEQVPVNARERAKAELLGAITPSQAEIQPSQALQTIPGLKGQYTEQEVNALPRAVAKLIDTLRVGVTGKKPLDVQQAEGTLTDALALLANDVDLVKLGLLNPRDARDNILTAEQSLNALERTQKGMGQQNLRYWSDNGREIQTEILLKRQEIDNLKNELVNSGLDMGFR